MKNSQHTIHQAHSLIQISSFSGMAMLLLLASGCANNPLNSEARTDQNISARGPTVVDARTDPATFELSRQLGPKGAEVIANVQDFESRIKSVKLSFTHVPLEIPMTHVIGNTWRAELTDTQLQKLAVEGTTMRYEAFVMATDKDGKISASPKSVIIAVKTPDLSDNG